MSETNPRAALESLMRAQRLAVLATGAGEPYANLVAYAFSPDFKTLFFATPRATRKYGNLRREPNVAMLIDSRANSAADFHEAVAVTVLGRAEELDGAAREAGLTLYAARHPGLLDFARAPSTSLFRVNVRLYVMVDHFQHVVELDPGQWP